MGEMRQMGAAAPGVGVWCPLQSPAFAAMVAPSCLGAGLVRNGTSLVVV